MSAFYMKNVFFFMKDANCSCFKEYVIFNEHLKRYGCIDYDYDDAL